MNVNKDKNFNILQFCLNKGENASKTKQIVNTPHRLSNFLRYEVLNALFKNQANHGLL